MRSHDTIKAFNLTSMFFRSCSTQECLKTAVFHIRCESRLNSQIFRNNQHYIHRATG